MIKITDRWYLDSDRFQFIIREKKLSKKDGKEYLDPTAFCGNLFQVKNWLLNQEIKDNLGLIENIDECIRLSNTIDKTLTGVGKR